jgi:hypothetical protein
MTTSNTIDDDTKRAICDTARSQPLGDSRGVQCADCGDHFNDGDQAKAYVIGDDCGDTWQISKVMHPDCGPLYIADTIGDYDDTEALVEGTVVHDPSVSPGGSDDTQGTEPKDAAVIDAPRDVHRFEDPEVQAAHLMSEERRKERQ